jgi:methyl-accepting chemotaxis protein
MGKEIHIRYVASPIRGADDRVVGAFDVIVDTTDLRTALNKAAKKTEQMGRAMKETSAKAYYLDSVPTPVVAVDTDFNVTYVNRAGAEIVGLSPSAAIGRKCYDLFKTSCCRSGLHGYLC